MKQLICRDIYLIRKNLLITFGIFLAFFLFGLLAVLSARYGNIAKYSEDIEFTGDVIETSLYFTILGAIILGTFNDRVIFQNLILYSCKKNPAPVNKSNHIRNLLQIGCYMR